METPPLPPPNLSSTPPTSSAPTTTNTCSTPRLFYSYNSHTMSAPAAKGSKGRVLLAYSGGLGSSFSLHSFSRPRSAVSDRTDSSNRPLPPFLLPALLRLPVDTSCILAWLIDEGYTVVCYMADVGQDEVGFNFSSYASRRCRPPVSFRLATTRAESRRPHYARRLPLMFSHRFPSRASFVRLCEGARREGA